jgi:NitT/TauT family transport system ATP-binding protein
VTSRPDSSATSELVASNAPAFEFDGVAVSFGGGRGADRVVLRDLSFSIGAHEFVAIVGPSGTGKTTLLRVAAGLMPPAAGTVKAFGEEVRGPHREIAMVFQDYASSLLPWRTVGRNVSLALEGRVPRSQRAAIVERALTTVGLADRADAYPNELSGGMQQRVQLARALTDELAALLMDEPFGALDAMTKSQLQDELQSLRQAAAPAVLFVTHDIDEAIYLSDRVLVVAGTPATIRTEVTVDLPRPRDQISTKADPRYLEIRSQLIEVLRDDT